MDEFERSKLTAFEVELLEQAERVEDILRNLSESSVDVPERRYKGEEITDRVKMKVSEVYLNEGRGKFALEMDRDPGTNHRLGYTLSEINKIQEILGSSPGRKEGDPPAILSVTNLKGGCWKSTTCHYGASYYADLGYKILLVDLDPQATLTTNFGFIPGLDIKADDTLLPFITRQHGFMENDVQSIIKSTNNVNIDLIPSCLDLSDVEKWFILETDKAKKKKAATELVWLLDRVRAVLENVSQGYDIVIIDGTPSIGDLAMNIILAADKVIVPVPTEAPDFAATGVFQRKLQSNIREVAELIGNKEIEPLLPPMRYMPTRFSSGKQMTLGSEEMIQCINDAFEDKAMKSFIRKHDAVISNLSIFRRTIFDINKGPIITDLGEVHIKKDTRERAKENFSTVFDEILKTEVFPLWPSKQSF